MKKLFTLLLTALIAVALGGCQYEYSIVGHRNNISVIETPGETVYIYDTGYEPAGEVWVDHFVQPASVNGVDIIWVIDTSGSMNRFDSSILLGIEAMMNALPASGWRLVMIPSDETGALSEAQFPLVPGDTIADAEAMYLNMYRGRGEAGFDAVHEYITSNNYASTWMRSDAALLVVFVSDEEEQSRNHLPDVSDFVSWYGSLRGGSTFEASIVNLDPSISECNTSTFDIGQKYIDSTSLLGGVVVDICSEDWSAGVSDASIQVEPHEEWFLTHEPYENSIEVFFDGAHVSDADWFYEPIDNKVVFVSIPGENVLVEIGYRYSTDSQP